MAGVVKKRERTWLRAPKSPGATILHAAEAYPVPEAPSLLLICMMILHQHESEACNPDPLSRPTSLDPQYGASPTASRHFPRRTMRHSAPLLWEFSGHASVLQDERIACSGLDSAFSAQKSARLPAQGAPHGHFPSPQASTTGSCLHLRAHPTGTSLLCGEQKSWLPPGNEAQAPLACLLRALEGSGVVAFENDAS